MSLKYRVRLQNDRIVGPFVAEEIGELFSKGHITGIEKCQQFPIGEWKEIGKFPNLVQIFAEVVKSKQAQLISSKQTSDSSSANQALRDESSLSKIEDASEKIQIPIDPGMAPFNIKTVTDLKIDYDQIDKKFNEEERQREQEVEDELERTRVIRRMPLGESEIDKTRVIPSRASMPKKDDPEKALAEESKNLKEEQPKKAKKTYRASDDTGTNIDELIANESTVVVDLSNILAKVNAELSASEVELEQRQRIEENQERLKQKELMVVEEEELAEDEEWEEDPEAEESDYSEKSFEEKVQAKPTKSAKKKKKKGMSWVVALTFVALFYVLLSPDEKPKAQGPQFADIKFPITQEVEDPQGAQAFLTQGRGAYAKNTYQGKLKAAELYINSLQRKFMGNEALGELILVYSELLEDTQELKVSANVVYKLIQLSENKMLVDLNTVMGTANFYGKIGKNQTGIYIIKNYMRAKGAISGKLLSYYLELLMNVGDLVEARKVFTKLESTAVKPIEAYVAVARFYEINDQLAQARTSIEDGLKYYPNSVKLLLKYADYLFKEEADTEYAQTLKKIELQQVEGSPNYLARFYYHMGIFSASKNKNKEAAVFFKKSLNIKETDELRALLSSLEVEGDSVSQSLILESKVIDLLKKSNAALKNNNLEVAFTYVFEAIDASPNYVPAILLQTKLQIRRGLFSSAIDNLQRAIGYNPANNVLKKLLVETYIKSFKFDEAQKTLQELSSTKYALKNEYASLMGDFYTAKENLALAAKWYNEALVRDPMSDYDMYQLAKIYVRSKKFPDAKSRLSKALVLDPKNPDYLATYSEILFEQDNTDTALGYLRDAISEIGEDPKLISAIASIYYKSGQIKEFQSYYKKVQSLPKKDEAFYEFLIKSSKLEENKEDYVNYCKEILKLNPGNLKIRIELGEFYFESKQYNEAIAEFEEIREKLNSYPKVHFWLAKVYLATNDLKKAKEMANKELELNPGLDSAHFISGEVFRAEKEYREAVLKYEKAISLNSKSVEALMAMAWIRLAQNYASESLELYNRALREEPSNPEIHKQMGFAYKAAGQRALAREKLEDYMKLSPGAADKDQIEALIRSLQ